MKLADQPAAAPTKRGRPRKYPFDELLPGENFFIEGKRRDDIAASMAAAERRTGFVFHAINGPGGVRIWRSERERELKEEKLRNAERRKRRSQIRTELKGRQSVVY